MLDEKVVGAVRPGGRVVTLRHYTSEPVNGVTFHPVRVRHYVRNRPRLDRLRELVEAGKVTPRVADTYPATEAAEAHRRLARDGTRGRLVLTFGD